MNSLLKLIINQYKINLFSSIRLCSNINITNLNDDINDKKEQKETILTKFINRNPRNLEQLGISWKRKGWLFQYPSKEFYYRLVFKTFLRNTEAYVEHYSGTKVITCSSKELAILKHLYSPSDVSAAMNIGRIIAERCKECGINRLLLLESLQADKSEKFQAFKKAVIEGGLDLSELEEVVPEYTPGIDYDDDEQLQNLKERQQKVFDIAEKSVITKYLNIKRKHRGRRRPLLNPKPLIMPAYSFK